MPRTPEEVKQIQVKRLYANIFTHLEHKNMIICFMLVFRERINLLFYIIFMLLAHLQRSTKQIQISLGVIYGQLK